jgi:hypothetical protein
MKLPGDPASAGWTHLGYFDFGGFDITGDGFLLACDPCYLREAWPIRADGTSDLGFSVRMIPGSYRATSLVAEFCGQSIGKRVVDLRIEFVSTSLWTISSANIKSFYPCPGSEADIVAGYPERAGFERYDDWGTLEVAVDTGRIVLVDRARAPRGQRELAEFERSMSSEHAIAGGMGVVVSTGLGDGSYFAAAQTARNDEEGRCIGLHFQFVAFDEADELSLRAIAGIPPVVSGL